jgi:hypothetical protein
VEEHFYAIFEFERNIGWSYASKSDFKAIP